jgi:hypothetical protein
MCDYTLYFIATIMHYESFEVANLTEFWEIVVSKFYDSYEGMDMLTIFY